MFFWYVISKMKRVNVATGGPCGQSFFFQKLLRKTEVVNTSWLCMLETSVLRILLEDHEAEQLH